MSKLFYPFTKQNQEGSLKVEVTIVEIKSEFGRKLCLVTPVAGSGKLWVNDDKLIVKK